MKKLFALLLVLCMLVGLVACGGKTKDPSTDPTTGSSTDPTTGGSSTTDPTGGNAEDPQYSMTPEKSPYNGKTLQIYGLGTAKDMTDFSIFGKGTYEWMMKAAMDEWAFMNGVTIEWKGKYNQATVLAGMNSGDKPDLVWAHNIFPAVANVGIAGPLKTEEYNKLAAICGESYLDALNYNGAAHGIVAPWTGNKILYYNKTMFENYGVKTPKEYFMEDDWTWENFLKCCEEMTKDLDNDGTTDTYGINEDSLHALMQYPQKRDETGRLVSIIDEPIFYDFCQLKYDLHSKKYVLDPAPNNIQKKVDYPMYAMQISDCEPYNFEHMYQTIKNGDELEVCAVPQWTGDKDENRAYANVTQSCAYIVANCDEREAVVDMLAYVLKVGLRYVSDYSLGAVKCDYAGIQGKSELSAGWKEAFAELCEERAADIKEIANYDEELVAKLNEYLSKKKICIGMSIPNFGMLVAQGEIKKMPPASAIPAIRAKYESAIKAYNDTYFLD